VVAAGVAKARALGGSYAPCVAEADILVYPCGLFFFFPRLFSAVGDWMSTVYFHTWCGLSANLECRSEMCGTWFAENTGCKNDAKIALCAPSHKFVRL